MVGEYVKVLTHISLEDYFVNFVVPDVRGGPLRESRSGVVNGLSRREHLGLVLFTYFLRWAHKSESYLPGLSKASDDGVVACPAGRESDSKGGFFIPVEQVYVFEEHFDDLVADGIVDVLRRKREKGVQYAHAKQLLIFCNAQGDMLIPRIKKSLMESFFRDVVVFGPAGSGEFAYNVVYAKGGGNLYGATYRLTVNSVNGECSVEAAQ